MGKCPRQQHEKAPGGNITHAQRRETHGAVPHALLPGRAGVRPHYPRSLRASAKQNARRPPPHRPRLSHHLFVTIPSDIAALEDRFLTPSPSNSLARRNPHSLREHSTSSLSNCTTLTKRCHVQSPNQRLKARTRCTITSINPRPCPPAASLLLRLVASCSATRTSRNHAPHPVTRRLSTHRA